MYAKVIVEIGVKKVDRLFTYIVPSKYIDKIKVGMRVKVSFGKMHLEGFVIELTNNYDDKYELKEIEELVDEDVILNKELLYLGKKIQESTLCSLISAYQVMLPKALKASINTNINIKNKRFAVINEDVDINTYLNKCNDKQKEIIEDIIKNKKVLVNKLSSSINTLVKNNIIKFIYEEDYRYKYQSVVPNKVINLTEEQRIASNKVIMNQYKIYLLYGITGSGKTEVYMDIIAKCLDMGKSAIMLVPEISLTPQILSRFVNRFQSNIAILHSRLSDSERYDEYRKIREGKVKIVIGARSAIFAPLTNLGVIVIDEEHTPTYKQDNHPRYNAKDVAFLRGEYHNCPVLLGSATPSLESMARALNKKYELITLLNRPKTSHLPVVHVVDMKEEAKKNYTVLSRLLISKIKDRLNKHEQIILLLNRRGYSSMITCPSCGYVEKCPNCDISLTYHKTSNKLRCHYCSYAKEFERKCPNCGNTLKNYGLGTQKLEEELNKMFDARVIRMDMDTTSKKGEHEAIIRDFGERKYDILLGTQMIAKGLDFPYVTLVGVINADTSLNIPDFRSSEYTYQLLSQVSGRAGRGDYPGEVIIQTFNEEHYSIVHAKNHDYLAFYNDEMAIRKKLKYSPYYYLVVVNINSSSYEDGFKEANKIGNYLRNKLDSETIILGPSMANIFKINNIYYYQCIIKYRFDNKVFPTLKEIDDIYKSNNKVNIDIDVNPVRM